MATARARAKAPAKIMAGLCLGLGALGLLAPPAAASAAVAARSARTTPAGPVYFRQVICDVPDFTPPAATTPAVTTSSCAAASVLSTQNLGTAPSGTAPNGFTSTNVPPDAALAHTPSTAAAAENAGLAVVLPGIRGSGSPRFLLGPAQMTSTGNVASASAHRNAAGQWVVDYTTTAKGHALWDRVARADFHRMLGIDVDGTVYSAPIIQPTQSSFTSFDGRGEIAGSLTKSEATALARALQSHSERH